MSPYIGEIRMFAGNFAPNGWMFCEGAPLPISENDALFVLIGTTYGGNGQTNFALPNLRGRVPISFNGGHNLGEAAGSTSVTVNIQQLPTHLHTFNATNGDSTATGPGDAVMSKAPSPVYGAATSLVPMAPTVSNVGGSQPHNNMMPYLVLNFIIALQGIFPSRN